MTEPWDDLRGQLPRHQAPAELRAAILRAAVPDPPRRWWWAPALSAAATAMAMALLWVSVLPRVVPADPLQRLARWVVSEHTRTLMWGRTQSEVEPAAWLAQETGIGLSQVFAGDTQLWLVAGEPTYWDGRRGFVLYYKDADDHMISYVVLPAPDLALPDRKRVQIDRFRPALSRTDGFAMLVWKHKDLACFLISDMVSDADLERFKTYFLRIRQTSEPYVAR
jgi:anti-sigma factor RsiW